MKTEQVVSFEKAMEAVSESMANFKRFVESTNKFLELHKLGTAVFDEDDCPEFYDDGSGYGIGMFTLRNSVGNDISYFNIYTNGTANGENLVAGESINGSWYDACREVVETIGALKHTLLSAKQTDKLIEKLGDE